MKVYVCTSGCYSDYCIHRVFLDKDVADKYKQMLYDGNDVEEYETDDELIRNSKHFVEQNAWIRCKYGDDGFVHVDAIHSRSKPICEADVNVESLSDYTVVRNWTTVNFHNRARIESKSIGYIIQIKRCYISGCEKTEDQLHKILHDIDAIVRAKLSDGFSINDIASLFENRPIMDGE